MRNVVSDMRYKGLLVNSLLVILSLSISYIVLEVGYRIYLFKHIHDLVTDRFVQEVRRTKSERRFIFDPQIGYRYSPNTTWHINASSMQSSFSINQYGMIANDLDPSPYPVEKPKNEYRIAFIGDSMTAGDPNYIRMTDLVQDYLNRSPVWRAFVGGKFTRVLNFGMAGTGFVQWGPVYEFQASRFSPDLVVVNFILDDVVRRFVYYGRVQNMPDDEVRPYIDARVRHSLWTGMSWFSLYPELFAATIGRLLGMQPRLTATAALGGDAAMFVNSQEEGIQQSLTALRRIRCLSPRLLVFNQPEYEELTVATDGPQRWMPLLRYLSGKFLAVAAADHFSIVNLAQLYASPKDRLQIDGLFNAPIDAHYSDYGTFVYSSWLTEYFLHWSSTPAARAPVAPAKCS